jgi:hypothetical protein
MVNVPFNGSRVMMSLLALGASPEEADAWAVVDVDEEAAP